MRGIVLAGGTGSRMRASVNKHCLQVHDRPMVSWAIRVLRDNGVEDVTVVSSASGIGELAAVLGGGYTYRVQDAPGGVAQALLCAEDKSLESVAVILGDNVFLPSPRFRLDFDGAHCFLKQMLSYELPAFGVPVLRDKRIVRVEEKPKVPQSSFACVGLYLFGSDVFYCCHQLEKSERGEVEITSLLDLYASDQELTYTVLDGFWGDAGTPEGLESCAEAARLWSERNADVVT